MPFAVSMNSIHLEQCVFALGLLLLQSDHLFSQQQLVVPLRQCPIYRYHYRCQHTTFDAKIPIKNHPHKYADL